MGQQILFIMNISTLCGLSTRFFTIVFCLIGFGLAQAQLTLPKTLDDPGTSPTHIINWSDYSSASGFQLNQRLESTSVKGITVGTPHSGTNTIRFVEVSDRYYSINHYRLTYTDDTQTTPQPIDVVADTIPITTNLQLQFTLDPFVAYQQEQYNPDELQPLTPYFGENTVLYFFAIGEKSPPVVRGTTGTPIVFSAAELAVLGDSDGHTLQLVQTTATPALSAPIHIAPNADTQSIIDSIQLAATAVQTYIEFTENDDGSLSIYADEALEIGEPDTAIPTASKTIDAPGRFPEVEYRFDSQDITITFRRSPDDTIVRGTHSDGEFSFQSFLLSVYQDYYYFELSLDAETPYRITPDNDDIVIETADIDSLKIKFWVDPFAASDIPTALSSTPLHELFEGVDLVDGFNRYILLDLTSRDASRSGTVSDTGTRGTAVSFTAEEITAITEAESTSLAVVQTATGLRSMLTVPTDTDAQALADHIQAAANPLTVYIHAVRGILSVVDPCDDADQDETCDEELIIEYDGTLDIYADEAIEIHYTTANTASIAPLRKQGVLVYPNPVHAQLHLGYPSATPASYTVYDLTGKVHSTHHANGQTHQLNVSSLAKGVYLLKAQHGNQTGVFRFVKE